MRTRTRYSYLPDSTTHELFGLDIRYIAQFLLLSALFLLVSASAPSLDFYLWNIDVTVHSIHGHQVLHGKFPFVDVYFRSGPLATLIPALGFLVSPTLVPQALICSFGYALSIFLISILVFRLSPLSVYGKTVIAFIALLCAYLVLAKFYKWYYWLFPLLVLVTGLQYFQTRNIKWIGLMGLASGTAWLFRIDLGVACMAASVATHLIVALSSKAFYDLKIQSMLLLGGFALPIGIWLVVLGVLGGFANIGLYFVSYFDAVVGTLTLMALPYPQFTLASPFSEESCHFLALLLVPSTYVFGLWVAWTGMRKQDDTSKWLYPMLALVAFMGIALLPQALHRKSIHHIAQIIPPFLVIVPVLLPLLWKGKMFSRPASRNQLAVSRLLVFCFVLLFAQISLGVKHYFAIEYESPGLSSFSRYVDLAQGASAGSRQYNIAEIAHTIQKLSGPDDSILIVPHSAKHIYYWADRRMSGMTTIYTGFYSQPRWKDKILHSVEQDPPRLIVVDESYFTSSDENLFKTYYPELYEYISTTYTKKAYTIGRYTLMVPGHPDIDILPIDTSPEEAF